MTNSGYRGGRYESPRSFPKGILLTLAGLFLAALFGLARGPGPLKTPAEFFVLAALLLAAALPSLFWLRLECYRRRIRFRPAALLLIVPMMGFLPFFYIGIALWRYRRARVGAG